MLRCHFKHSSTTSAADGAYQLAIDGVTELDRTDITIDTTERIWGVAIGRPSS